MTHLGDVDTKVGQVVDSVHLVQREASMLIQSLLVSLGDAVAVHDVHGDDTELVGRAAEETEVNRDARDHVERSGLPDRAVVEQRDHLLDQRLGRLAFGSDSSRTALDGSWKVSIRVGLSAMRQLTCSTDADNGSFFFSKMPMHFSAMVR